MITTGIHCVDLVYIFHPADGVHKNQFRTIRNDVSGPSNDSSSTVTVLIAAFSFVVLTVFLSSIVISFIFCYCCHKRSRRDQCDQELENGHAPMMANFGSGDMCEAIIPQGENNYLPISRFCV